MTDTITHALILLRGLPGSGKSTLAKLLSENGKYPIHSIDEYFTDKKTGEYRFDFQKNHLAYKNCEEKTEESLAKRIQRIFIDNTFTIEWELEPYFKLAQKYTYAIFVITVENRHNGLNIHEIPRENLEKMAAKYQVKLLPET
ncbi:MAG: ATP-binding protein [Bacteroidetes bacterium]|nr:ATP-binding protein [Bacteroidota bacterium]